MKTQKRWTSETQIINEIDRIRADQSDLFKQADLVERDSKQHAIKANDESIGYSQRCAHATEYQNLKAKSMKLREKAENKDKRARKMG